jgi:hypothetical protein
LFFLDIYNKDLSTSTILILLQNINIHRRATTPR